MIPRTLVPLGSRLPSGEVPATQRRRPTTMDERTLVPSMLPIVVLDGKSTIPRSLPLESIAARVVVPRDVNQEAYQVKETSRGRRSRRIWMRASRSLKEGRSSKWWRGR